MTLSDRHAFECWVPRAGGQCRPACSCRCHWTKCVQCGEPMTPVDAMMGPVCGECARINHKAAVLR